MIRAILIALFAVVVTAGAAGAVPQTEYEVLLLEPATQEEQILIQKLRASCRHDRPDAPVDALLALLRLEEVLGVDKWRRGLLGGIWCVESGWRGGGEMARRIWGDYREGTPMAHGPFQLWPTHRRACRGTRSAAHDLIWAARCWVARVEAVRRKALARCPARTAWGVAEAAVSNHLKYRWNCQRRSEHWKVALGVDDES